MKRLHKSAHDRMISGVLGGIAEYFNYDSTMVRLIYVVLSFTLIGSPVLLYILMALIIPDSE